MQGRSGDQRELLDVESVSGHLLPAGSVFAFLAEHRGVLFPDAMFADMYPSRRGRPSRCRRGARRGDGAAGAAWAVGLRDGRGADGSTCGGRPPAGWPVDDAAFHPSLLTYWRRRLAALGAPEPDLRHGPARSSPQTGVLKGKHRRALDSTVLDDAVATQDTVTQLIAAIRRVSREVPGAAEVVAAHCTAHDYTDPGKPRIAWDDRAPGPRWSTRWSPTRSGCSAPARAGARTRGRPTRSRCWRWSPARTWSRPRTPMAPTAGGGSPARSPRTG